MTIDDIIGDCTLADPQAADCLARLIGAMPPPNPGHGDAFAASSGSARQLAGLLTVEDVIGYETRDALPEEVWNALRKLVTFSDEGDGMTVMGNV